MFCQAIFRNSLRNVGPINNVRRWIEFLCELCMSVDMKKSTKAALKWTKWYQTKNRSRPISWSADHARRCSTWKLPPASKDDGKIHENCREWHWKNSRASLYNPVVYPYHSRRFSSLELFSQQSSPKSHRTHIIKRWLAHLPRINFISHEWLKAIFVTISWLLRGEDRLIKFSTKKKKIPQNLKYILFPLFQTWLWPCWRCY